jgi:nucleoside-diphosphate-sugar epimerase
MRNINISRALPRLAGDFLMVHLSMLAAIFVSIYLDVLVGKPDTANALAGIACSYYTLQFLALSFVFPLVFSLHGFYTSSRLYSSRYKVLVAFQGVAMALVIFLAANFLLFRENLIPRIVALLFASLAISSICVSRLAKNFFLQHFQITPMNRALGGVDQIAKPILVVGGAGYIGSLLIRRLLAMGKKVRVLDNLIYGDDAIRDLRSDANFELIVGDCRDIQCVVGAVRNVDSIVHLAAIVGDPACEQDRQSALEINYAATRMLIEIAKGHGVSQFVFASSCSVYGATECVVDEHAGVYPISLYAHTKVDSEQALLAATSDSFSPVILRFATVFGHSWRPRFDLVVNMLTAKAYQESMITIFNGEQWRPFIHVRDIAEAVIKILAAPHSLTRGQIYNIGDSRLNYTLTQVAERVRAHFPSTQIEYIENADKRNYRVSFEKVKREVGFECSIGLDEGIAEMHQAFMSGTVENYTDVRYHNQRFLQRSGILAPPNEIAGAFMAAFTKGSMTASVGASKASVTFLIPGLAK